MNQQSFEIERVFEAPVERVWVAITDKNVMKQWYFDIPAFKPEEGSQFSFVGTDNDNKQWVHLCEVKEVIPNKKLTHSWRYKDIEGNTLVTWELFPEGNGTRVKLTHSGFETFPPIPSLARENFVAGWTEIVGTSLKEFLEKQV